ncbi:MULTISPECIES: NAD(P)-binding domain-containing protein [Parachlamydia]|jgi:glutamyl-tRNA reductase|uniref:Glutamyl-tRNA reductase n=1 Tax=Parachlamydia acanthamoebae (strain UV7) TaxID=765952 RepID=F8L178_PARAV|nr:NAD(P)-binding domain-containing protein [Parachlamydia acanthamoebae]CCB87000.1 glutamyl-tRNA reductase [Parachlamydia acanthamoebae UV-7]
MRVGVVGINHKLGDLKLRESLAKVCHRRFGFLPSSYDLGSFVLLSTCNRTEVYFFAEDLAATHSYLLNVLKGELEETEENFDQKLYSYFNADCFLHLVRVTTGLDSAILAETEIQGQVKQAYESACAIENLPFELHYLFQKALKIGKDFRSLYSLGRGIPDLEHAVFNIGQSKLQQPEQAKVLFIGASEINQKILKYLKHKNVQNISLCNRSLDVAQTLAKEHQIDILNWEEITKWSNFDWIILGTKCPEHLLTQQDLYKKNISHKLVIDLSVPRNVEPKLARDPRITLLNIDHINRILKGRKKQIHHLLASAEQFLETTALRQIALFQEKEQHRLRLVAVNS